MELHIKTYCSQWHTSTIYRYTIRYSGCVTSQKVWHKIEESIQGEHLMW